MAAQSNESLIVRIADDVWNRGDLAAIDEIMAADAVYHGPHMPNGSGGREGWRRAIELYHGAFPDANVVFDELIQSGDTVVGRWRASGTHTGPLPGLAPTGKQIEIGGITIYRLLAGRIAEAWEQLDLLGMWRQLGVVDLPEASPPFRIERCP